MNFWIIKPEKKDCLCDKKIFFSRAGIPFSKQYKDINIVNRLNDIYIESLNYVEPIIYYSNFEKKSLPSKIIPKIFKDTELITIFISTLGHCFDRYIENLSEKKEIFKMTMADSWASESIEKINRYIDKSLREKYLKGTRRFSPGYQDIDVTANKIIVENIFGIKDIKVLKSGQMLPRKTTVCLIGWYI